MVQLSDSITAPQFEYKYDPEEETFNVVQIEKKAPVSFA